jgi:hypothetical protein
MTPTNGKWSCGFYPGSRPGEIRNDGCDQARAEFEAAWALFLANRTEADFQAWRYQQASTAWKYRMWDTRHKLPTQLPGGRSTCFWGAEMSIAGVSDHIRATTLGSSLVGPGRPSSATNSRKIDRETFYQLCVRHRSAMNVRNAVLLLFATAVACGLVWALHSLAHTRSWESFAVMCVMMLIVIIAIARYTPLDQQR